MIRHSQLCGFGNPLYLFACIPRKLRTPRFQIPCTLSFLRTPVCEAIPYRSCMHQDGNFATSVSTASVHASTSELGALLSQSATPGFAWAYAATRPCGKDVCRYSRMSKATTCTSTATELAWLTRAANFATFGASDS